MSLDSELENLRVNALRNALYHTDRRKSLEWWNRAFNFAVVVLGAAAVGDVLTRFGITQSTTGVAIAVVAAAQLVFDFGRQARDHQGLQRDYYNVLSEIEECIAPDDQKCASWRARMTKIAGEEPPVLRALDAKAYNAALDALDTFPAGERLYLPFWHLLVGWFYSFPGHHYEKLSERRGWKPPVEALPAE